MGEPIRVLQVIGGMGCGGAENMIMNLYRKIDRTQVQFDFLVHTEQKCFFDDEISKLGGNIYHIPKFRGINVWEYRKSLNQFFDEHSEFGVVHGHIGSCAHIYLDIAKKHGAFAIAHSHSSKPTEYSLKNLMYYIFTYKTRHIANFFIGCSLKAGEYRYGKKIVSDPSVYITLNNAIDTDKFIYSDEIRKEVRSKLGLTDELVIGHVGRLEPVKNHEYLLKIFQKVCTSKPNAVLLLLGDGSLHDSLILQAEKYGIADKVILLGVRSDVHRFLQAMDCFVFPSWYEGLPVTLVEAQAAGLPCLVSDRVTKEIAITNLVKFKSIDILADEWANDILNIPCEMPRKDMRKSIEEYGYDIADTSKWLEHFYISHSYDDMI